MCQAVVFDGERLFNLNGLLAARLITHEHVPSDAELARNGVDVREVCFCAVDVEEILDDAGVPFTIDDLGDIYIAEPAADPEPILDPVEILTMAPGVSPWDAWEALARWWRRRRAAWPQPA